MNRRRLWAIARKETLHIRRDPRSLGLALGIPMLMLLLFGFALTLDLDRVPLAVWDQSGTPESRDYVAAYAASRYFRLVLAADGPAALERAIDTRRALLAMVIPADFAEHVAAGRSAPVQLVADGSDSNTAAIALTYAQLVNARHNAAAALEAAGLPAAPALDLRIRVWFNPDLESRNYIVPGITAVILGLIAALLTSLTVAREWETGTMEQLVSTPVRRAEVVLGKLLPYFALGMLDALIATGMAVWLFGVPLRGSAPLLLACTALFIVGTLGQGLFISTLARGQLLASQMAMLSTFLPAFLLSGFMFPIANMPAVVQAITFLVPARYFVALVKGIFLRGVGLEVLWPDAVFLAVFAVLITALAVLRFRRRLA